MRTRVSLLTLFLAGLLRPQGLEVPGSGWFHDAAGALRPLGGVAGNWTPGPARETGVISAASSDTWTLAKTHGELIVLDRSGAEFCRRTAPPGPALFAFAAGGDPAVVLFPETGELLRWSAGRFEAAGWNLDRGEGVLAIAARAVLFVRRGDRVWRVDRAIEDGRVLAETVLAGVRAPLAARPDGSLLYAADRALVLRASNGVEVRIELPGEISGLSELAGGWIRAVLPDRQIAVSFSGATPRVFELPGGER